MFEIKYRVAKKEYTDFLGDKGYYQVFYNGNVYGDIYSEKIEGIIGAELLYDWFRNIILVSIKLYLKKYVTLNDFESPKSWVEFERSNDDLNIIIVFANKPNVTNTIVYKAK
jgi:hypothetical protein